MYTYPYQPEIEFIVDNSHYVVPFMLVKPFSSTIRHQNPNDQSMIYKFENLSDPQKLFKLVINLFYGGTIDINQNNAFFLGYVGDILGITPLSEATNSYRQVQLTFENIFDILGYLGAFHISEKNIIKFAGDNWPILSKSEKALFLPVFILNEIFSKNPQVSVTFDFLSSLIQKKSLMYSSSQDSDFLKQRSEIVSLFKYCEFSTLTSSQMNDLLDYVSFDSINPQILKKFTQRLTIGVKNGQQTQPQKKFEQPQQKIEQTKPPVQNSPKNSPSKNSEPQKPLPKKPDQPNASQPLSTAKKTDSKFQSTSSIATSPNKSPTSPHLTSSTQNFVSETTAPSAGINGSRRNKPSLVLPQRSGSVNVEFETGYELRGVVTLLQDSIAQWKKEVDLIVPKNMKGESFKYSLFDHSPSSWWSNYDGKKCSIDTAWIIVGFHHFSLKLTYYTLASRGEKPFYSQPMSWKIYGSNDPAHFDEKDLIVYVKNAPSMNVPKPLKTFKVEWNVKSYTHFKFVLLKNFTARVQDQGELSISGFELFGVLTAR